MTAIIEAYTKDGFVIGADGRRLLNGQVESDTAQKIYPFEWGTIRLAYAWAGLTEARKENSQLIFDIHKATPQVLSTAAKSGGDLSSFVGSIKHRLSSVVPIRIDGVPLDYELARLILVGYFDGQPCRATIKFAYPGSDLIVKEQVHFPASYHKGIFAGEQGVSSDYVDWKVGEDRDAIQFADHYIRHCSRTSENKTIGGHIHIATVKPEGFSWVIAPICE